MNKARELAHQIAYEEKVIPRIIDEIVSAKEQLDELRKIDAIYSKQEKVVLDLEEQLAKIVSEKEKHKKSWLKSMLIQQSKGGPKPRISTVLQKWGTKHPPQFQFTRKQIEKLQMYNNKIRRVEEVLNPKRKEFLRISALRKNKTRKLQKLEREIVRLEKKLGREMFKKEGRLKAQLVPA